MNEQSKRLESSVLVYVRFSGMVRSGRYKGGGTNNLIACSVLVDFLYYAVDMWSTNDVYKYVWFWTDNTLAMPFGIVWMQGR